MADETAAGGVVENSTGVHELGVLEDGVFDEYGFVKKVVDAHPGGQKSRQTTALRIGSSKSRFASSPPAAAASAPP